MTDILIRNETPGDYNAIKEVNNLAFNQSHEGELIENDKDSFTGTNGSFT
jgi:predicted N-acetyltransferase YhbS